MPSPLSSPRRTGNLAEVFQVAFPLIMSAGTFAFKLFTDRLMLAWYAEDGIAAALSAGNIAFMMLSFFMGVANYANAFVAQYSGAGRHDRTGLAIWQAILFSLAAGMFLSVVACLGSGIFYKLGHAHALAGLEEGYFLVLNSGAVFALLNSALMCFWTGRNKTWTVVAVGFASIFLNVLFNWALIFGASGSPYLDHGPWPLPLLGTALNCFAHWLGAPSLGVVGAGLATIGTDALQAGIFLCLFLRRDHRRLFGTWPERLFNANLLWRMLRFGFGNGMQLFLDVGAFAVFLVIMARYGIVNGANVAAASGVAITMNGVAFIPMLGIGSAASILVGHGIGARDIPFAERAVKNSRLLIMTYMVGMSILFEIFPQFLVSIFSRDGAMTPATGQMAVNFVRFAGVFCLFDGFFILYGNAIRGAGDTKFCMYVMAFTGWFLFAIPCIVAYHFGADQYTLWVIIVLYTFFSASIFYWRYRQGKWKDMRVIEDVKASQRRGAASVRLSTPVVTPEAVLSLPGDEMATDFGDMEEDAEVK